MRPPVDRLRRLLALISIVAAMAACSPAPSPASPSATLGVASAPPVTGPQASPVETVAQAAGLKLVAVFDRTEVEAGGTITVALSIQNTRATDVVFEEPCDTATLTVGLLVPGEPVGREWDGIAAAFKTYALENSMGSPMESSIRTPLPITAKMLPCHAPKAQSATGQAVAIIEAGTTYQTVLTWTADIVRDVPASPGSGPFSIEIRYDLEPAAGGMVSFQTLEASGTITILEGAPGAISAGRALDAVLGDPKFANWLAKQPQNSWVNANLFLQPRAFAADPLPEVPYWDVELYREPRNWAVMFVDAASGEVLHRIICEIPCDR